MDGDMKNPNLAQAIFQVREFTHNDWSVVARVWDPQKSFYEHPKWIGLSKEEAQEKCNMLITSPIDSKEVMKKWTFIGS